MQKVRLYACGDGLWSGSGFGEQLRHILYGLAQTGEYEVILQSLQHLGYPIDVPDTIFPDLPQKGATVKVVPTHGLPNEFGSYMFPKHYYKYSPDILLFLGDPRNVKTWIDVVQDIPIFFVFMTTLDGLPIPPSWQQDYFGHVDMLLTMSEWALHEFQKANMSIRGYIHHGIRTDFWQSNPDEKKRVRAKYGIPEDTVLFIDRNTNQHRKRTDLLLKAWKLFKPESKNAKLLLWCDWNCRLGYNIEKRIKQYDIPRNTIISPQQLTGFPKIWEAGNTVQEELEIAKMGDIQAVCSSGEGFGLVQLESIALKCPVIATKFSAIPEVVGKGGILVPPYDGEAGWYSIHDGARSVDGAVVNVEKFAEAMRYLYDNPAEREELGELGREHALKFDFERHVIPAWRKVLSTINPDEYLMRRMLNI